MFVLKRSKSVTMASLVLAIAFSSAAHAQAGNEQMMNLVLQMQQLQDEIRAMRGQLEEQGFELEQLRQSQRDQYLDLDRRLSGQAGGAAAAVPQSRLPAAAGATPQAPVAASPSAQAPGGSEAGPQVGPRVRPELGGGVAAMAGASGVSTSAAPDLPEVSAAVNADTDVVAIAAPQEETRAVQATPEMEQAAYDEAFQSLKELRYADAAKQFQAFLVAYPDSTLAGNAQYWLGESYYVTRNYEIALEAFETLGRRYPDSSKSGDGLLKIGFTYFELKQYDQARAALEQVQQRYPNSTLSRLAESRLRSMRVAGHY